MKVAVITMARNESVMLPRWVAHYGAAAGERNLYVLDDGSDDGSTTGLAATVITMPVRATEQQARRSTRSPTRSWRPGRAGGKRLRRARAGWGFGAYKAAVASKLAVALLEMYDVVVYTDADEFIVPDPRRYAGLGDYLEQHEGSAVLAPVGLNLVHLPGREPTLRSDMPLLAQRRHVKVVGGMCKPAIKRIGARWSAGTHGVKAPYTLSRDLYLLHAKYADYDVALSTQSARHREYLSTGAGKMATWTMQPAELAAEWSVWTATDGLPPVLDFETVDLDGIVREEDKGFHRSFGTQAAAMLGQLYRLPEYLTTQV
jgi:hypothetical protein